MQMKIHRGKEITIYRNKKQEENTKTYLKTISIQEMSILESTLC